MPIKSLIPTPKVLQIDTTTRCNDKCIYCNPQNCYNLGLHDMDLDLAERVMVELQKIGWNKEIIQYRPYLNGEPILDKNLNLFARMGKLYLPNAVTYVLSNGGLYPESKKLLHPCIDVISLTISASSISTYIKIHRFDGFINALKTFDYIKNNKSPKQRLEVNFVLNKYNEHEVDEWRHLFSGADKQNISAIHKSDIQLASKDLSASDNTITNVCNIDKSSFLNSCNCWNNLAISWDGRYIQCCVVDYSYNYGKVGEVSLRDAWINRLKDGLNCAGCNGCSVRRTDYKISTGLANIMKAVI